MIVVIHHVRGCFEDHLDHLMTEVPSMPPLVKIGTHCSIPDRRTTTLKNAKFISQCQFATINYRTLGEESILLPTGDVFTKGSTSNKNILIRRRNSLHIQCLMQNSEETFLWDGVQWKRSMYGTRNRWASLYYLENMRYYVG